MAAGGGSQRESLVLAPWASRRRQDRLDLLDQLTPKIQELTRALEEIVEKRTVARRLRTHPGVRTIEVDFGFGTAAAAVLNSFLGAIPAIRGQLCSSRLALMLSIVLNQTISQIADARR